MELAAGFLFEECGFWEGRRGRLICTVFYPGGLEWNTFERNWG